MKKSFILILLFFALIQVEPVSDLSAYTGPIQKMKQRKAEEKKAKEEAKAKETGTTIAMPNKDNKPAPKEVIPAIQNPVNFGDVVRISVKYKKGINPQYLTLGSDYIADLDDEKDVKAATGSTKYDWVVLNPYKLEDKSNVGLGQSVLLYNKQLKVFLASNAEDFKKFLAKSTKKSRTQMGSCVGTTDLSNRNAYWRIFNVEAQKTKDQSAKRIALAVGLGAGMMLIPAIAPIRIAAAGATGGLFGKLIKDPINKNQKMLEDACAALRKGDYTKWSDTIAPSMNDIDLAYSDNREFALLCEANYFGYLSGDSKNVDISNDIKRDKVDKNQFISPEKWGLTKVGTSTAEDIKDIVVPSDLVNNDFIYDPLDFGLDKVLFNEKWAFENAGNGWATFSVKTKSDLYVELSPRPGEIESAVLVIEGDRNQQTSWVGIKIPGSPIKKVNPPANFKISDDWTDLWIQIKDNKTISFGTGTIIGSNKVAEWTVELPTPVKYIGFGANKNFMLIKNLEFEGAQTTETKVGDEVITLTLPEGWGAGEGKWESISCGNDKTGTMLIYGVGPDGNLYKYDQTMVAMTANPWKLQETKDFSGKITDVSVAQSGEIIVLTLDNAIFKYDEAKKVWTNISGDLKFKQAQVANENLIVGITKDNKVQKYDGKTWTEIAPEGKMVTATYKGEIFAINYNGQVTQYKGAEWTKLPDAGVKFNFIAAATGLEKTTATTVDPKTKKSTSKETTVETIKLYGIDAKYNLWQFDSKTGATTPWTQVLTTDNKQVKGLMEYSTNGISAVAIDDDGDPYFTEVKNGIKLVADQKPEVVKPVTPVRKNKAVTKKVTKGKSKKAVKKSAVKKASKKATAKKTVKKATTKKTIKKATTKKAATKKATTRKTTGKKTTKRTTVKKAAKKTAVKKAATAATTEPATTEATPAV